MIAQERTQPTLADLAAAGWEPGPDPAAIQPRPLVDVLATPYAFYASPHPADPADPEDVAGWEITFPDLPGCSAFAGTWDQVGTMAHEAAQHYLTAMWKSGYPVPVPTGWQPEFDQWEVNHREWADERQRTAGQDPTIRVDGKPNPEASRPRYSVEDLAQRLELTPGRIRQIASEHDLGRIVAGARWFSQDDFDVMRRNRRPPGRPPGKVTAGGTTTRPRTQKKAAE